MYEVLLRNFPVKTTALESVYAGSLIDETTFPFRNQSMQVYAKCPIGVHSMKGVFNYRATTLVCIRSTKVINGNL